MLRQSSTSLAYDQSEEQSFTPHVGHGLTKRIFVGCAYLSSVGLMGSPTML
jgi:hypothetical protein